MRLTRLAALAASGILILESWFVHDLPAHLVSVIRLKTR